MYNLYFSKENERLIRFVEKKYKVQHKRIKKFMPRISILISACQKLFFKQVEILDTSIKKKKKFQLKNHRNIKTSYLCFTKE